MRQTYVQTVQLIHTKGRNAVRICSFYRMDLAEKHSRKKRNFFLFVRMPSMICYSKNDIVNLSCTLHTGPIVHCIRTLLYDIILQNKSLY